VRSVTPVTVLFLGVLAAACASAPPSTALTEPSGLEEVTILAKGME